MSRHQTETTARHTSSGGNRRASRFGLLRTSRLAGLSVALAFGILASLLNGVAAAAVGTVELKVLIVSSGNNAEDSALELMTRTLDSYGTPYDVVNSNTTTLTSAMLYNSPTSGKYNGVIVTVADLYQSGGGSGFTLAEWQLLHQYERDFAVRESVVSGFPTWDPSLDLDYGMGIVGLVNSTNATWVAPAGGTDLFEYVNTANALAVTGPAWTGGPRNDGIAPTVTPLLIDPASNRPVVSKLVYTDGRETLLSTVSNAWFYTHSYVLAYEMVTFATRGLFIGSRQVNLSVHTDDLLIDDELWNPVTNTPTAGTYRMSPADVTATINNQNAFRVAHPLASSYITQFPFNGYGAGNGTRMLPNEVYTTIGDAELRQFACVGAVCSNVSNTNRGAAATAVLARTTVNEQSRFALRFENQLALGDPTITTATLTLNSVGVGTATRPARVCRATQDWTEGTGTGGATQTNDVSWLNRTTATAWTTAGGSFDANNCVTFNLRFNGATAVNITPIFGQWAAGQPDYGVVVMLTTTNATGVTLRTREATTGRPTLTLTFPVTAADPLTASIVANRAQLAFINHTYASRQMDRVCPEFPNPQPPLCGRTSYLTARNEILRNRTIWTRLGLPEQAQNTNFLLSDSHAGLHDRMGTEENPADDIAYPTGLNPNFFQAMADTGVRYIATDSSRPNQNQESFAPGYAVFTSPRYPAAIWVNSSTPAQETDQYNWIFHDSYVANGQDPCTIPAAICQTKTYQEILDGEGQTTLLHMLSNNKWPHYMHQINLRAYDGTHQIQFDWLNAVMTAYDRNMKLPVQGLKAWQLGPIQERLANVKAQNVRGTLDLATGIVTLVANGTAQPTVTGLNGGTLYGGQYQLTATVGVAPTTYTVNAGLTV
jgi:hypothetical protein